MTCWLDHWRGCRVSHAALPLALLATVIATTGSAQAVPSLTEQFQYQPQDTIRTQRDVADQFLLLGKAKLEAGDHAQAITALTEAANAYHYLGDLVGMGEAYEQLVKVYSSLGRYDQAEQVVRQQLAIANSNQNFNDQILAYNNLGTLKLQDGNLAGAHAAFGEALTVARDVESDSGIGLSLSNLGLVATANGQLNDARKYYEVAANYRARARDYLGQANTDSNLGDVYLALGRSRQAIGAYRLSLSLAQQEEDLYLQLRALDGLISIYRQRNEPQTLSDYLNQRIQLAAETGDEWQRLVTLRTLGEIYEENGDLSAARDAFEQAMRIASLLNRKPVEADLSNRVRSLSLRIGD
ncbi:MAG: tetratricopeptide repeat protein [Cyanobacteria bacterium P01_D01_bin.105]